MKLPIALGLALARPGARTRAAGCDWTRPATWEFFPLDDEAFPAVRLARRAGTFGAHRPGGLQRGQRGLRRGVRRRASLDFLGIVDTVGAVLDEHLADPDVARQEP